jgi:hypothetical protein
MTCSWYLTLVLVCCVAFTSWYGWQLVTRRPVLTVNQTAVKDIPALARWLGEVLRAQRVQG